MGNHCVKRQFSIISYNIYIMFIKVLLDLDNVLLVSWPDRDGPSLTRQKACYWMVLITTRSYKFELLARRENFWCSPMALFCWQTVKNTSQNFASENADYYFINVAFYIRNHTSKLYIWENFPMGI